MTNLPFVSFYPGKWLGRTAKLSATERGVFISLICEMYENMEPIKYDEKRLARLCGTTPNTLRKCCDALLEDEHLLVRVGSKIWNNRVEREIKTAQEKSKKQSKKSIEGWKKRKENNDAAMPRQSQPKPEPYIITSNNDFVFDANRWFTTKEIEIRKQMHPHFDVEKKLSEYGFRKWAFETSPQDPLVAARNWLDKNARTVDADSKLKELRDNPRPIKISDALAKSAIMKGR